MLRQPRDKVLRRLRRLRQQRGGPYCGAGPLDGPEFPAPYTTAQFGDSVLAFAGRPARLREIAVTAAGATTAAGVTIGARLSDAQSAYKGRGLDCHDQTDHDGARLFPSCVTEVGPYTLYFGGDPIREIDLSYHTPTEKRRGF